MRGRAKGGKVGTVMREYQRGTLHAGMGGKRVKSRKQAVAIGLSEARRAGEHVSPPPGARGKAKRGARGMAAAAPARGRRRHRMPKMGADHGRNASRLEAMLGDGEV